MRVVQARFIAVGAVQRRSWWLVLALVSIGLKPQLIVFANKALLFCPLCADGSWKVGAECRCLCRDVYLVRCGGRNHYMGSVW